MPTHDVRDWALDMPARAGSGTVCVPRVHNFSEDDVFTSVLASAEESEVVNHLAAPPVAFGVTAFVILTALLLVTYAFRSVWTRH